jgi:hypothetical protein
MPADVEVFGAAPSAPTDLKVKIHGDHANLSWRAPDLTGGGVIGYDVEKFRSFGHGGGISLGTIALLTSPGIDVTTNKTHAVVPHVRRGTRYVFLVSAVNAFGATFAHSVHAAVLTKPGVPRKVAAFGGKHSILLSWHQPAIDGGSRIRHYRVEYARGCAPGAKGCHAKHQTVRGFQNRVKIGGLKAGTTYQARVIAIGAKGSGRPSQVVKATTSK